MVSETSLDELLKILGCPGCKGPLYPIEKDGLYCKSCHKGYLVKEGVFTFLQDDARVQKTKLDWDKEAKINHTSIAGISKRASIGPFDKRARIPPAKYLQDKVYLELGCGYGRTLIPLTRKGTKISIGVDISAVLLNKCREYCDQYQANCVLVNSDVADMPFQDDSFDVIYSAGLMQHLDKDIAGKTVSEVKRILKKGGKVFFYESFPNKWHLWMPIQAPEYFTTEPIRHQLRLGDSEARVRRYTCSEVAHLFRNFSKVEINPLDYRLLPQNIGPFGVPYRSKVKRLNQKFSKRMEQINNRIAAKFLVYFIDVVAYP